MSRQVMRDSVVEELRNFAKHLGTIQDGSTWYLFGSADRNDIEASDIDLLILCHNDAQADALRKGIDPDAFSLPLDLSLMTFDEAAQIDAIRVQKGSPIHPMIQRPPV